MTGAYMTWTYGPAGWIEDLNQWITDPSKTNPKYDWEDVLPGLRASTAWNGVPGGELGSKDAKQWCIPWGFELNSIAYNRNMYDKAGVQPPKTMPDLLEIAAKLTEGPRRTVWHRRARLTVLGHDPPGIPIRLFELRTARTSPPPDGKLKAAMNTKGSKEYHNLFVQMVQNSGPKNWSTYTWYQVGTDLGAGRRPRSMTPIFWAIS